MLICLESRYCCLASAVARSDRRAGTRRGKRGQCGGRPRRLGRGGGRRADAGAAARRATLDGWRGRRHRRRDGRVGRVGRVGRLGGTGGAAMRRADRRGWRQRRSELDTSGPTCAKHRYSKVVTMNATDGGRRGHGRRAEVPVAVVLNAMNFDSARRCRRARICAREGGRHPAAHEMSLGRDGKLAAVWVQMDVKGNDAAQSFVCTGRPPRQRRDRAVFSKDAGFLGVWRLDEEGNATEGGYATPAGTRCRARGQAGGPRSRVSEPAPASTTARRRRTPDQWVRWPGRR